MKGLCHFFAIITLSLRYTPFDLVNNKNRKKERNPNCFLQICKATLNQNVIAASLIPAAELPSMTGFAVSTFYFSLNPCP